MSAFRRLSRAELADLTGRRRRKCITGWLTAHGWIFERDANGWPIVSAAYAEKRKAGIPDVPVEVDLRLGKPSVYVMEARHLRTREALRVKVGYSLDPESRLSTARAQENMVGRGGIVLNLALVLEHPDALAIEQRALAALEHFNIYGEWFGCDAATAIAAVKKAAGRG